MVFNLYKLEFPSLTSLMQGLVETGRFCKLVNVFHYLVITPKRIDVLIDIMGKILIFSNFISFLKFKITSSDIKNPPKMRALFILYTKSFC